MTRHHLFLALTVAIAAANAAIFCWQGYALCVLAAVVCAVAALEFHDRLSARS